MLPDDPRHGTYAGAVNHWIEGERPCAACEQAEWRYRKQRQLDALQGSPRTVPGIGSLRRFQALQALGWTHAEIAAAAGVSKHTFRAIDYHKSERIRATTAAAMERAYDRLCMTVPNQPHSNRIRVMSKRKQYVPPLAWTNIDDPDERPDITAIQSPNGGELFDPVVVERILSGDAKIRATNAERAEVARRWHATGRPLAQLAQLTGWKVERYWKAAA